MKKFFLKLFEYHPLIFKLFLYIATVSFVVYLFPKGGQFKYEFQKGKPWQYDNYYAPFNFAIQKSSDDILQERNAIKENSKQYFDYNDETAFNVKKELFSKINEKLAKVKLTRSKKNILKNKAEEVIDKVYEFGLISKDDYVKITKQIIILRMGNKIIEIAPSKLFKKEHLNSFIINAFNNIEESSEKEVIIDLLLNGIRPNITFDENLSTNDLMEALNNITYTKGLVSENERIISKGDIVEGVKLEKLNSLKNEYESQIWSKSNYNYILIGYTVLVALAFLMLLLFLRKYRKDIFENNNKVTFIFVNVVLIILLVSFIVKYDSKYVYIAPIVTLPLVLKAFFDSRLGLFTHTLTVLLLGFIVPNSFEFIFLQIIAGMVTILTISELYKRANLFLSVLKITVVYFIAYFAFSIIQDGNAENLNYNNYIYFGLNGMASLFVLPLIYIYEKIFGLVSDESLKELSNTNSKLLRELAEKAPGTFQHSLQVANLAEASANEINANSMLVRTGALYHDIGKMENPMYFTENQTTGVNPHNDITPKDSTQIIINHIIDGVELAKKYHLPERIIDFIRTHHGTTVVYFFYKKEEELNNGMANEDEFRYPGPIPFSKETAILMMCDSVEAASKSIKVPFASAYDELVEKIINKQMKEGQFMNADITFRELQIIKKVLKKKLKNINHVRIEYPE